MKGLSYSALAVVLGFATAWPALAQVTTAEPATAADAESDQLDEIVVTAQKREERLMDVPLSVTAISGEALSAAGASSTRDLSLVTPGLVTVQNSASFAPAIRGISSLGTSAGEEANVALYVDDAYQPTNISGLAQMKDVLRVEVLKGPQGTLFGRNATAGAIRTITRDPSFDTTLEASLSYGFKYHERRANLYAATGLTDKIAVSAALFYDQDDGYIRNVTLNRTVGSTKEIAGRVKVLFLPSDNAKIFVTADKARLHDNWVYNGTISNSLFKNVPGIVIPSRRFATAAGYQGTHLADNQGVTLNGTFDWDTVGLKVVTAYRKTKLDGSSDADRIALPIAAFAAIVNTKAFSQEVNLFSEGDTRLRWIAGLYYFHSNATSEIDVFSKDTRALANFVQAYRGGVQTESYAGFGELTYNLTDTLYVTGGARYTTEQKDFSFRDIVNLAGPLRTSQDRKSFDDPTFRALADWTFTPGSHVYASFSTGFKSGVYNTSSAVPNVVNPEKINAIEVGLKARLPGGADLTLAAFNYDYKDIQLQALDTTNGQSLVLQLRNAAQAKIRGVEGSIAASIAKGLRVDAGAAWTPKAEYTSFPNAQIYVPLASGGNTSVVPVDLSHTRMVQAPKFTATAGVSYTGALGGGELSGAFRAAYNSGFYFAPGERLKQSSYTLLNANLSWGPESGTYRIGVFGRNLGDEKLLASSSESALGDSQTYVRGREMGVSMDLEF